MPRLKDIEVIEKENAELEQQLEPLLKNKRNIPFQRDREIDKRRYNNWLKKMRGIQKRQELISQS